MKLTEIDIVNFRNHEKLSATFGDITEIRAHNAHGKSGVLEAIVWCICGTNIEGKTKKDQQLLRKGAVEMAVTTRWVSDSGDRYEFTRLKPPTGAQRMLVNGRKEKPGEIEGLFGSPQEFLSIIAPGFFKHLEPKAARPVLAKAVPDVPFEEVLQELRPDHRKLVKSEKFAVGIDSMEFLTQRLRKELKEAQVDLTKLEGTNEAYLPVLQQGEPKEPQYLITPERIQEYADATQQCTVLTHEWENRESRLAELKERQEDLLNQFQTQKALLVEVPDTTCKCCGQPLPTDKAETIRQQVRNKNKAINVKLQSLQQKGRAVRTQINSLEGMDLDVPQIDPELQKVIQAYERDAKKDQQIRDAYKGQLSLYQSALAKKEENEKYLESQRVLVEELKAKIEAMKQVMFHFNQLQKKKLDAYFNNVDVQLWSANEDGEIRSDFVVTWKGQDARRLSASESIRCDIEIGRVLAAPRLESMPVFIDNAESIEDLYNEEFSGQVLAAYVDDYDEVHVQVVESGQGDLPLLDGMSA